MHVLLLELLDVVFAHDLVPEAVLILADHQGRILAVIEDLIGKLLVILYFGLDGLSQ